MRCQIPSKVNSVEHQFLLKPISGEGRVSKLVHMAVFVIESAVDRFEQAVGKGRSSL